MGIVSNSITGDCSDNDDCLGIFESATSIFVRDATRFALARILILDVSFASVCGNVTGPIHKLLDKYSYPEPEKIGRCLLLAEGEVWLLLFLRTADVMNEFIIGLEGDGAPEELFTGLVFPVGAI